VANIAVYCACAVSLEMIEEYLVWKKAVHGGLKHTDFMF
jgi:hypothetical protein